MKTEEENLDDCRGDYSFVCGNLDCSRSFSGDDLAAIAQSGARHWNKEHGREIRHHHEAIDEVQYGGHHIQDNAYEVRKYKVYLTSFDIMQRIGCEDGRLVPSNEDTVCHDCLHDIPDEDDRLEDNPDDRYDDSWTCRACRREKDVEEKKSKNRKVTEWLE